MIAMVAASSSGEDSKLRFVVLLPSVWARDDDASPSPSKIAALASFVVVDDDVDGPNAGVVTLSLEYEPKLPPVLSRFWDRERKPAVRPMRRRLGLSLWLLVRVLLLLVLMLLLELGVPIVASFAHPHTHSVSLPLPLSLSLL